MAATESYRLPLRIAGEKSGSLDMKNAENDTRNSTLACGFLHLSPQSHSEAFAMGMEEERESHKQVSSPLKDLAPQEIVNTFSSVK